MWTSIYQFFRESVAKKEHCESFKVSKPRKLPLGFFQGAPVGASRGPANNNLQAEEMLDAQKECPIKFKGFGAAAAGTATGWMTARQYDSWWQELWQTYSPLVAVDGL